MLRDGERVAEERELMLGEVAIARHPVRGYADIRLMHTIQRAR